MVDNGISLILGVVMPPIVDIVNNRLPDKVNKTWFKYLVALVLSLVGGVAVTLAAGDVDVSNWESFASNFAIIFVASQTVYNTYWKDSSLRNR